MGSSVFCRRNVSQTVILLTVLVPFIPKITAVPNPGLTLNENTFSNIVAEGKQIVKVSINPLK